MFLIESSLLNQDNGVASGYACSFSENIYHGKENNFRISLRARKNHLEINRSTKNPTYPSKNLRRTTRKNIIKFIQLF